MAWALAAAALAADWFFIAVLSAAMKKDIFLGVLCASSEAPKAGQARGEIQIPQLSA
jgi:hypothetical protein